MSESKLSRLRAENWLHAALVWLERFESAEYAPGAIGGLVRCLEYSRDCEARAQWWATHEGE